ncbi:VOC family protein [Congregibacter sp.]|uniref:VOC family protein n=1 Tax=Congregibacter sp. TaxID=2744308 RepID=UPI003F6B4F5A
MMKAVAPYLCVRDGAAAIEFYKKAFAAEEVARYGHEGKLGHATLRINDHLLMLADEFLEMEELVGNVAPDTLEGRTTFTIALAVDDADQWFDRAIEAGATAIRPVTDEFFGRHGKLRDPFGHVWSVVTMSATD